MGLKLFASDGSFCFPPELGDFVAIGAVVEQKNVAANPWPSVRNVL